MDIDSWASRVHSAKHFSAVQASRLNSDNHSLVDDSEGDDDAKACFPCPFCYVDIEVHLVCSHLQEEHCFDLKNAVCPLCAANLGKDATEHFIVQHASLLKRRKRFQKSGLWNGGSAMLGKELSSFLGYSVTGRGNAHESVSDPLLSKFLCNAPLSDNKITQQDDSSDEVSVASDLKREPTFPDEVHEEEIEERRQRATFIQQLILSTVF
ncbi:protein DEHYDRATION-INDUCED 19 homolog 6-like [Pistacia vera]|uniref:protein DEHYDRATION-INDUCED 19 homolog 6-like n=1 Tax=Pistacia vera TaxID=55513 RepID=UPI001263366C|nr:protein DEHYDRATION-INDUCED 19 homolog 6-like [Pistacia vera]